MSIELKGVLTPPLPETRSVFFIEVNHNNQIYDWRIFAPIDVNISDYLASKEAEIYAEIDAKEAAWAALNPKTRIVKDPLFADVVVDIQKSEIVAPDTIDYYAARRAEYPPVGDQLDAIWKGPNSPDYTNMVNKIQAVKDKYPKPNYST